MLNRNLKTPASLRADSWFQRENWIADKLRKAGPESGIYIKWQVALRYSTGEGVLAERLREIAYKATLHRTHGKDKDSKDKNGKYQQDEVLDTKQGYRFNNDWEFLPALESYLTLAEPA